jgi:P-type Cu2+ transporter
MLFLAERLAPVRDALLIARRARGLMQQNLWLAVIYDVRSR